MLNKIIFLVIILSILTYANTEALDKNNVTNFFYWDMVISGQDESPYKAILLTMGGGYGGKGNDMIQSIAYELRRHSYDDILCAWTYGLVYPETLSEKISKVYEKVVANNNKNKYKKPKLIIVGKSIGGFSEWMTIEGNPYNDPPFDNDGFSSSLSREIPVDLFVGVDLSGWHTEHFNHYKNNEDSYGYTWFNKSHAENPGNEYFIIYAYLQNAEAFDPDGAIYEALFFKKGGNVKTLLNFYENEDGRQHGHPVIFTKNGINDYNKNNFPTVDDNININVNTEFFDVVAEKKVARDDYLEALTTTGLQRKSDNISAKHSSPVSNLIDGKRIDSCDIKFQYSIKIEKDIRTLRTETDIDHMDISDINKCKPLQSVIKELILKRIGKNQFYYPRPSEKKYSITGVANPIKDKKYSGEVNYTAKFNVGVDENETYKRNVRITITPGEESNSRTLDIPIELSRPYAKISPWVWVAPVCIGPVDRELTIKGTSKKGTSKKGTSKKGTSKKGILYCPGDSIVLMDYLNNSNEIEKNLDKQVIIYDRKFSEVSNPNNLRGISKNWENQYYWGYIKSPIYGKLDTNFIGDISVLYTIYNRSKQGTKKEEGEITGRIEKTGLNSHPFLQIKNKLNNIPIVKEGFSKDDYLHGTVVEYSYKIQDGAGQESSCCFPSINPNDEKNNLIFFAKSLIVFPPEIKPPTEFPINEIIESGILDILDRYRGSKDQDGPFQDKQRGPIDNQ